MNLLQYTDRSEKYFRPEAQEYEGKYYFTDGYKFLMDENGEMIPCEAMEKIENHFSCGDLYQCVFGGDKHTTYGIVYFDHTGGAYCEMSDCTRVYLYDHDSDKLAKVFGAR
jgi:hypothetical protein